MDQRSVWLNKQYSDWPTVYDKTKHIVFSLIYLLIWARFLAMIADPYFGGVSLESGLPIYRDWRPTLGMLYWLSGWLVMPVYLIYGWLAPWLPKTGWFPGMQAALILKSLETWMSHTPVLQGWVALLNAPALRQTMVGYIDLLSLIAIGFFRLLNPLLDRVADFLKNLIWNILIEFSFTRRKEATYQEALGKRAADLMKLNVEYKNLSKEATMLAQSVITDELTRVYNKRFFIEKITYEFKQAKDQKSWLSIVMIDIDHFKKLNDTYGHLMGDKVLKAVAQVAKGLTPADCFCCRFGGEEFSIIMPGKLPEEAYQIVSQVHQSLPLLRFEDDPNLRTSASFGLCIVDFRAAEGQALNNFEELVKLADDGLYRAKLNGRNRIEQHIIR